MTKIPFLFLSALLVGLASAPASAQEATDSTNTIIVSKSGEPSAVFGRVTSGLAKGGYVIGYVGTPYALHVQPAGNPNVTIRLSFSADAERTQINITATLLKQGKSGGSFQGTGTTGTPEHVAPVDREMDKGKAWARMERLADIVRQIQ